MRVTIPVALLSAALLSGAALGQRVGVGSVETQSVPVPSAVWTENNVPTRLPLLEEGFTAYAMATKPLKIKHVSPTLIEQDSEPAGTAFSKAPAGPACPHWPIYGCGVNYKFEKASHGYAYTYSGRDLVQVDPKELGHAEENDNLIVALFSEPVPAFVDVKIESAVYAAFSYNIAEVFVPGYGIIRHDFKPGLSETEVSVPVELSPTPLPIHVKTTVYVNNVNELVDKGLVDLNVQITVRLPSASYEIEGAASCLGSNGTPFLSPPWALPVIGSNFTVVAMNLPWAPSDPAYGLIGPRRFLPFSLEPMGMPNCFLYISSPLAVPLVKCCGTAEWTLPIPVNMDLLGADFYQQIFAIDRSGPNPFGATITNVGHGVIGVPPVLN